MPTTPHSQEGVRIDPPVSAVPLCRRRLVIVDGSIMRCEQGLFGDLDFRPRGAASQLLDRAAVEVGGKALAQEHQAASCTVIVPCLKTMFGGQTSLVVVETSAEATPGTASAALRSAST